MRSHLPSPLQSVGGLPCARLLVSCRMMWCSVQRDALPTARYGDGLGLGLLSISRRKRLGVHKVRMAAWTGRRAENQLALFAVPRASCIGGGCSAVHRLLHTR
jgi:hypothetical protein